MTSRFFPQSKVVFLVWAIGLSVHWMYLVFRDCTAPQKMRFKGSIFNGSQVGPVATILSLLAWLPAWAIVFIPIEYFFNGKNPLITAAQIILLVFIAAFLFGLISGVLVGVYVEFRGALFARKNGEDSL